jgi:hypothetical protein
MYLHFSYDKATTIKGLRHHFISKPEIKALIIFINVFAIASAILFYLKKIQPISFFIFSLLWFVLLLCIWVILPRIIYAQTQTFKEEFVAKFDNTSLEIQSHKGVKEIPWSNFSFFKESPDFFYYQKLLVTRIVV